MCRHYVGEITLYRHVTYALTGYRSWFCKYLTVNLHLRINKLGNDVYQKINIDTFYTGLRLAVTQKKKIGMIFLIQNVPCRFNSVYTRNTVFIAELLNCILAINVTIKVAPNVTYIITEFTFIFEKFIIINRVNINHHL